MFRNPLLPVSSLKSGGVKISKLPPSGLQFDSAAMRGRSVVVAAFLIQTCCRAVMKGNKSETANLETEMRLHNNRHFTRKHGHIKSQQKALLAQVDVPIDAFTLHHPFVHSNITEFEYSKWYFLFLILFDKNAAETLDVSLAVPQIIKSLSFKLSVPESVFSISKAEKYESGSISANLTLTSLTIPGLHEKLSNLQEMSPLFWLLGTRYKLVQVLHSKNIHFYVGNNGQVRREKEMI